jgi:hypothetical protein
MKRIKPSPSLTAKPATLGAIKGWLNDSDPFFTNLEAIREESRREKAINPFLRRK